MTTRKALSQFKRDLQQDKDYIDYKKESVRRCFTGNRLDIRINYHIFDVDNKQTTILNKQLKQNYNL